MTGVDRDRPDPLSVPEMLRIMDVATALRQDREVVEEQLNFEALKQRLKERMLAASKVTGEEVTPEEVDAAIDRYYASLYTFHEPKMSFPVALAHLWVRRKAILGVGCVLVPSLVLAWTIFFAPRPSGEAHRAGQLAKEIFQQVGVVRTLARDPKVAPEIDRLVAEAETYRKAKDPNKLASVHNAISELEAKLREEYSIIAVPLNTSFGKNQYTILRYPPDNDGKKIKAYYLFVQARKGDGTVIPRRIHNNETGSDEEVTTWAEQIPEAVFERLKKDKLADGILNETAFGVKRPWYREEEVTMPGPDGKPLTRMGQITKW